MNGSRNDLSCASLDAVDLVHQPLLPVVDDVVRRHFEVITLFITLF